MPFAPDSVPSLTDGVLPEQVRQFRGDGLNLAETAAALESHSRTSRKQSRSGPYRTDNHLTPELEFPPFA